eukprot:TRINITY_DN3383_c0_g2_i1.p1 TRINITY_DN3383_c0_g2~~TRINITY_DN3383_c0_g2_i1.p1  ORF type:complete len:574 (+),score=53.00 TRINITY_DN3383_c0_g2_i1:75-1796(+)
MASPLPTSPLSPPPVLSLPTLRGCAPRIESLVDKEGVGDLEIVVNGGRPIRVLSCILEVQVPYFENLYANAYTEQDSGKVEFQFEVAGRQHVVDILRCAHGADVPLDIDSLGAHHEVARYWCLDELVAQLWDAAERLIDTPEKLHRARIIDGKLLDKIANGISIYSDYACAFIHWGLRHDALELACRAAGGLSASHALRIAQYIPSGDLKDAICGEAASGLVFDNVEAQEGYRSALCALRASADGELPGLNLLLAERPGALMLRLSSGAHVSVGAVSSAHTAGGFVVMDSLTLGCIFRSDDLPCLEPRLLVECRRLLYQAAKRGLAEVQGMMTSCLRFSLLPTSCLYEARVDIPNDSLCSLLFQRYEGYECYGRDEQRYSPARVALVLAGAWAATAVRGILGQGTLVVRIKGRASWLSGTYERQEGQVRGRPYWHKLYGKGIIAYSRQQWMFGLSQENVDAAAGNVRSGWYPPEWPQEVSQWDAWDGKKWQETKNVTIEPYRRDEAPQAAAPSINAEREGGSAPLDGHEPRLSDHVPVHVSVGRAKYHADPVYADALAFIEELVGCEELALTA